MKMHSLASIALALAFAGCAENKAHAPAPVVPAPAPNGAYGSPYPNASFGQPPSGGPGVQTANLNVSDEIARACSLPKVEYAPSFDYDSATIGDQDRAVLAAIAKCLSDGPLKGRGVQLVGRADPRGEDEYNMTLGESRSDSVRRYLHDLGVKQERLRATSRGELDANGTDEASWARDRRVDIDLTN